MISFNSLSRGKQAIIIQDQTVKVFHLALLRTRPCNISRSLRKSKDTSIRYAMPCIASIRYPLIKYIFRNKEKSVSKLSDYRLKHSCGSIICYNVDPHSRSLSSLRSNWCIINAMRTLKESAYLMYARTYSILRFTRIHRIHDVTLQ
jgi:hypothetical protein